MTRFKQQMGTRLTRGRQRRQSGAAVDCDCSCWRCRWPFLQQVAGPRRHCIVAAVGTPDHVVATPAAVDACWTDDQRVEGDDTMPQQYTEQPAMRIDSAKTYTGVPGDEQGHD